MRKVLLSILLLFVVSFGSVKVSKIFIPESIQVYIASLAGCDIDQKAWAREHSNFEKIKWWEILLAHLYNLEQRHFSDSFIISDLPYGQGQTSVFHVLLLASESTAGACEREISSLYHRYVELGAPLDFVGVSGFTPLQEAIITHNIQFVELLLASGADSNLRVHKNGSKLNNLNSVEIAEFFVSNKPTDPAPEAVLNLLKNAI